MSRAFKVYDLPRGVGVDPHVQATSTGLADVKTVTAPTSATACLLDVETNGIRFTLDGTTPDATNGMTLAVNDGPLFLPLARDLKFVSQMIAGNAILNTLWLE